MKRNKYTLYQASVQDPEEDVALYRKIHEDIHGKPARVLREDFCAGFAFSCEWVKQNPKNIALCLDIDPDPLNYGRAHNLKKLKPTQKKRVHILQQNVMTVTSPKADLVMAGNFSFFFLKERAAVLQYFKAVFRSMASPASFVIEIAGGHDFLRKAKEQRLVNTPKTGKFTYVWDQKSFDPITSEGQYAIHFRFPDGSVMKDAFTYDWRIWSVREIRELMTEAGFKKTCVFWEKEVKGEETGEYVRASHVKYDDFWLSYVIGMK